jgi:hypothetical protein
MPTPSPRCFASSHTPPAEAIVNTDGIAAHEYRAHTEKRITLWVFHRLKELDDDGFIDNLVAPLSAR